MTIFTTIVCAIECACSYISRPWVMNHKSLRFHLLQCKTCGVYCGISMYYIGILKEKLPCFDIYIGFRVINPKPTYTHTHTHTHTHMVLKIDKKNSKYPPRKVSVLSWKPMGLWGFWNDQKGQFSESEIFKQPEPVIHNKIKYPPNNTGSKLVMEWV